jgi:hypothetical protein
MLDKSNTIAIMPKDSRTPSEILGIFMLKYIYDKVVETERGYREGNVFHDYIFEIYGKQFIEKFKKEEFPEGLEISTEDILIQLRDNFIYNFTSNGNWLYGTIESLDYKNSMIVCEHTVIPRLKIYVHKLMAEKEYKDRVAKALVASENPSYIILNEEIPNVEEYVQDTEVKFVIHKTHSDNYQIKAVADKPLIKPHKYSLLSRMDFSEESATLLCLEDAIFVANESLNPAAILIDKVIRPDYKKCLIYGIGFTAAGIGVILLIRHLRNRH